MNVDMELQTTPYDDAWSPQSLSEGHLRKVKKDALGDMDIEKIKWLCDNGGLGVEAYEVLGVINNIPKEESSAHVFVRELLALGILQNVKVSVHVFTNYSTFLWFSERFPEYMAQEQDPEYMLLLAAGTGSQSDIRGLCHAVPHIRPDYLDTLMARIMRFTDTSFIGEMFRVASGAHPEFTVHKSYLEVATLEVIRFAETELIPRYPGAFPRMNQRALAEAAYNPDHRVYGYLQERYVIRDPPKRDTIIAALAAGNLQLARDLWESQPEYVSPREIAYRIQMVVGTRKAESLRFARDMFRTHVTTADRAVSVLRRLVRICTDYDTILELVRSGIIRRVFAIIGGRGQKLRARMEERIGRHRIWIYWESGFNGIGLYFREDGEGPYDIRRFLLTAPAEEVRRVLIGEGSGSIMRVKVSNVHDVVQVVQTNRPELAGTVIELLYQINPRPGSLFVNMVYLILECTECRDMARELFRICLSDSEIQKHVTDRGLWDYICTAAGGCTRDSRVIEFFRDISLSISLEGPDWVPDAPSTLHRDSFISGPVTKAYYTREDVGPRSDVDVLTDLVKHVIPRYLPALAASGRWDVIRRVTGVGSCGGLDWMKIARYAYLEIMPSIRVPDSAPTIRCLLEAAANPDHRMFGLVEELHQSQRSLREREKTLIFKRAVQVCNLELVSRFWPDKITTGNGNDLAELIDRGHGEFVEEQLAQRGQVLEQRHIREIASFIMSPVGLGEILRLGWYRELGPHTMIRLNGIAAVDMYTPWFHKDR